MADDVRQTGGRRSADSRSQSARSTVSSSTGVSIATIGAALSVVARQQPQWGKYHHLRRQAVSPQYDDRYASMRHLADRLPGSPRPPTWACRQARPPDVRRHSPPLLPSIRAGSRRPVTSSSSDKLRAANALTVELDVTRCRSPPLCLYPRIFATQRTAAMAGELPGPDRSAAQPAFEGTW